LGTGVADLLARFIGVVLEVLVEQLAELRDLFLEIRTTSPALLGVEKLVWNVRALLGDVQIENIVGLVFGLGQFTAVDGIEDGTRILEGTTFACSALAIRSFASLKS
jgi:hypothetical protein